jgi:uncharacterized protein YlzI (FlbEa/FlbD family)
VTVVVAALLVLLHGPDGREILLNADLVVSMHAAIKGKPNTALTDEVRCLINTSDGKFISVVESCDQVLELIGRAK